jgi:hypothetical protein
MDITKVPKVQLSFSILQIFNGHRYFLSVLQNTFRLIRITQSIFKCYLDFHWIFVKQILFRIKPVLKQQCAESFVPFDREFIQIFSI